MSIWRVPGVLSVAVLLTVIATGCGGDRTRHSGTPAASPAAPSPVGSTTGASGAAGSGFGLLASPGEGGNVVLPPEAVASVVAFPPRNEGFLFRQELERKYRDGLRRQATSSFVDIEGDLVWTQEYLRYRVNTCGHVAATQKGLDQIDGRGIAPVCNADLSGVWNGESSYFNAPFVFDLVQAGTTITGTYRDRHDAGPVTGSVSGNVVRLAVNFGDTGLVTDGRWDGADVVSGDLTIGGGVGRRSFEMSRQR